MFLALCHRCCCCCCCGDWEEVGYFRWVLRPDAWAEAVAAAGCETVGWVVAAVLEVVVEGQSCCCSRQGHRSNLLTLPGCSCCSWSCYCSCCCGPGCYGCRPRAFWEPDDGWGRQEEAVHTAAAGEVEGERPRKSPQGWGNGEGHRYRHGDCCSRCTSAVSVVAVAEVRVYTKVGVVGPS